MTRGDVETFIAALNRLESDGDVDGIASLFSEGAELRNPTAVRPERGREGARRFWETYRRTFKEVHSEFRNVVESDGTAILEWRSRGRTDGGREFDYDGVSVVEFEDGRIRRFRSYYDPADLGEQLFRGG